jgi:hypothetical protein
MKGGKDGGGYYDRDVFPGSRSSGGFDFSDYADYAMDRHSLDPALKPYNRRLVCNHLDPLVLAMDVTGSMGNWAKIIYDKAPMAYGQIMLQGYLKDLAVSFAAIGDILGRGNSRGDEAPLQICDFAQGKALDGWLERIWLEGGGGGQGYESYEMAAYFYARCCDIPAERKGFFFFTGDEGFRKTLPSSHLKQLFGIQSVTLDARDIFRELEKKFHVFMIHKPYDDPSEDRNICASWRKLLGERFIVLHDPKAVVDVMLGAIAITAGVRSLDEYLSDMRQRGQTPERLSTVVGALEPYTRGLTVVDSSTLPPPTGENRRGGSRRLR